MQSGTKVSVRYRSGRLSGVVVKRGSTVYIKIFLYLLKITIIIINKINYDNNDIYTSLLLYIYCLVN